MSGELRRMVMRVETPHLQSPDTVLGREQAFVLNRVQRLGQLRSLLRAGDAAARRVENLRAKLDMWMAGYRAWRRRVLDAIGDEQDG